MRIVVLVGMRIAVRVGPALRGRAFRLISWPGSSTVRSLPGAKEKAPCETGP